ncbi:MAG: carbohydrate kinase family protein, partial [Planctomycetota bacterium]
MGQSIDLIAAGHICLDITPQFSASVADRSLDQLLRPGSLVVVDRAAVSTGGGAANVGLSARRLGLSVAMMGKCGDDVLGRTLLEVLRGFSADCAAGMRIAAGESTSYTVVLAPPGTDRVFLHCPGANDTFVADDVDLDLVARGRLFYFGYPPLMARMYAGKGEELAELLRRVKDRGVTVALDM